MGWWSTSIMGGDQPLDIEHVFEETFAALPADTENEAVIAPISAEGAQTFMNRQIENDDDPVTRQVVGFLLMRHGAPLPDNVRALVLEGIEQELNQESDWKNPEERFSVLRDFAQIVKAYPTDGGTVELPNQPGLWESIMR